MADHALDHPRVEYATADGNDYPAHEQTYQNFVTMVKIGLGIIVVILILMAYFLV
jgi:Bacterial aa3 type cytochrome c oxidase subunit IV